MAFAHGNAHSATGFWSRRTQEGPAGWTRVAQIRPGLANKADGDGCTATIGGVDWGTAGVAIVVAALGIAGGYFGARWRARSDLAQWQRERLLEFCADLLAAGGDLRDASWEIGQGNDVPYPAETMRNLAHAYACVTLLSQELSNFANRSATAYADLVRRAYAKAGNPDQPAPDFDAAATNAGRFAREANHVLLGVRKSEAAWWRFWSPTKSKPDETAV